MEKMLRWSGLVWLVLMVSCHTVSTQVPAGSEVQVERPLKRVTRIEVYKSIRKVHIYDGDSCMRVWDAELGFAPVGHKQFQGDGKTPEGSYVITDLNEHSQYYKSAGISYPNAADRAYAQSQGRSPGGDIRIHGLPNRYSDVDQWRMADDWTLGCIAVSNRAMDELFAVLRPGTPVVIYP